MYPAPGTAYQYITLVYTLNTTRAVAGNAIGIGGRTRGGVTSGARGPNGNRDKAGLRGGISRRPRVWMRLLNVVTSVL
jgi:hypothetical protein